MSVHKVLDSAELLGLILGIASTSTCARLISTSRNFFEQGIIYIWKNLLTAKPLILLIPGAEVVELDSRQYTIRLPSPPADFSRFDVYAPLVQSLNTFGPKKRKYLAWFNIDSSWQTLELRAQESTLLPNLKEFSLNYNFKQEDEPVLWVSAFISPSLTAFNAVRVQRGDSAVTSSTLSIILKLVARDCPKIESLTLFPGSLARNQDSASLLHVILEEPISRTWQKFQNLSSLVTDVNALDAKSLSSLGKLPYLNTLEIRGTSQVHPYAAERLPDSTRRAALSEGFFPSLRHLTVLGLHFDDIMTIWDLESVVQELTHLKVLAHHTTDAMQFASLLAIRFLAILCVRSPKLTDLSVQFLPDYLCSGFQSQVCA
ncbi:hypothetical protein BDV93DRAFT_101874 [Ceratobasidium sp. AG-I]|nr:hypothetical protein BDV93DRAFT_101874 [Ceratobasidium sp. AG-I]